jgi:hypothetical protein
LDQQRLNAFLAARGLFERGSLSIDATAPGAIAAVVLYDTAVETAAKATLSACVSPETFPGTGYDIPESERSRRRQLAMRGRVDLPWALDQLLAIYRQRCGDERRNIAALDEARELHRYRNRVHHEGIVPSQDDLDRQRLRAGDFIKSLVEDFFGKQLTELSRASLIADETVRIRIEQAEVALSEGDLRTAMNGVVLAFAAARDAFRQGWLDRTRVTRNQGKMAIRELRALLPEQSGRQPLVPRLEQLFDGLTEHARTAEDRLEALSLGAQASDYTWFQQRFPSLKMLSSPLVSHRDPPRISREELLRGLDFVTNVALRWQQFPPVPQFASEPDLDEANDEVQPLDR